MQHRSPRFPGTFRRTRDPSLAIVALAVLAIVATARGQSFNIDIGPAGAAAPAPTYGAAGRPGHWMKIPATQGVIVTGLVDVDGVATAARLNQIGGTETLALEDPDLSGDDGVLMNDCLITHTTVENCIFLSDMEPGSYEVIVYARMPAEPDVLAVTNVDQEAGNPHFMVGGAWTGEHELLVSYSIHVAEVAASGPEAGKLGLHSGVAPGGDFGIGAALNAFQVRRIEPVPGDVDGDEDVDFDDLLAVLASWGPCPPPPGACPADLDGSGDVTFADLLEVLAGWS